MPRQYYVRKRVVVFFLLQTMLCLCGLIFSHIVSEGQIEQLGNLTRNVLEHSVNVETALFKIQSLPSDQVLELFQGTSVMYSEPDAIEKSVNWRAVK